MSAENNANKALTLNNFLDQKFKELRQQKLSENTELSVPKSEEISISSENPKKSNFDEKKLKNPIENVEFIQKPRKSTPGGTNSVALTSLKKRTQSTFISNLERKAEKPKDDEITKIEPNENLKKILEFNENPNKNPENSTEKKNFGLTIHDPEVDKRIFDDRRIETPTFEPRPSSKTVDPNRESIKNVENVNIENKIVVKMGDGGVFSKKKKQFENHSKYQ